ncbi:MAG TPA: type B 50S ribosomal protein L31 [Nevskiaceae bacterium]|nr:type B 50S ribosomal protein L31 [Nevskiaceae bacterium]
MKEGIHPDYRPVAFKDSAGGHTFIIRSTVKTREKATIGGVEYPLVNLDTSSLSHPFYTGKQKQVEAGGRVSKFQQRYKK